MIAFRVVDEPEQIVSSGGITLKLYRLGTFTVTVTVSETEQPNAEVTVTVYVVVTEGAAVGFALVVFDNAVEGDHA